MTWHFQKWWICDASLTGIPLNSICQIDSLWYGRVIGWYFSRLHPSLIFPETHHTKFASSCLFSWKTSGTHLSSFRPRSLSHRKKKKRFQQSLHVASLLGSAVPSYLFSKCVSVCLSVSVCVYVFLCFCVRIYRHCAMRSVRLKCSAADKWRADSHGSGCLPRKCLPPAGRAELFAHFDKLAWVSVWHRQSLLS